MKNYALKKATIVFALSTLIVLSLLALGLFPLAVAY
jgi:hypothetical protein